MNTPYIYKFAMSFVVEVVVVVWESKEVDRQVDSMYIVRITRTHHEALNILTQRKYDGKREIPSLTPSI